MLLYIAPQMLRTSGFLVGLMLFSLAAGLWVARETSGAAQRRRWLLLLLSYVAAGVYTALWATRAQLNGTPLGGALAALFLLALPFYSTGALLAVILRSADPLISTIAGIGAGVVASGFALIPRYDADVIFFAIAATLLAARVWFDFTVAPSPILQAPMTGKVALVTGVGDAGQVGFALARAIVEAGGRVACVDRSGNSTALAQQLGTDAIGLSGDLTDEAAAVGICDEIRARFGRLDAVINAAGGLTLIKPLAETTTEEWRAELQRNADTAFVMSRAALPLLREAGGAIVNFASPAGLRAPARLGAYSAGKAAVIALTRTMAIEEKNYGIRVNAIAPGMIDTESNRKSVDDPDAVRWVSREEIASVVVFLCSDAAKAITGETITVVGNAIQ